MKKTIEEASTIDEFLESHIDTEEGLTWYKDRLVAVEKETNGKEVSYRIKFLIAQLSNIKFPKQN